MLGLNNAIKNIPKIYKRKAAAAYAFSLFTAAKALQWFRGKQGNSEFWNNQTHDAMNRVFTDAYKQPGLIAWFIAHGVNYGPYLEQANDRKNEALRPTINHFINPFTKFIKEIYAD